MSAGARVSPADDHHLQPVKLSTEDQGLILPNAHACSGHQNIAPSKLLNTLQAFVSSCFFPFLHFFNSLR